MGIGTALAIAQTATSLINSFTQGKAPKQQQMQGPGNSVYRAQIKAAKDILSLPELAGKKRARKRRQAHVSFKTAEALQGG